MRRVLLDPIVKDPELMTETVLATRPAGERWMTKKLHPLVERMTRKQYGIDPERVEPAQEDVLGAFDKVEARVRPSGYLVVDHLTVAALAGASLLAPLLLPPEYPELGPYPAELEPLRESLTQRGGGQWVLEMYRRHRTPAAS